MCGVLYVLTRASLMFLGFVLSEDGLIDFLGLVPSPAAGTASPSLCSDDIYSSAFGEVKIALALFLSFSESGVFFYCFKAPLQFL